MITSLLSFVSTRLVSVIVTTVVVVVTVPVLVIVAIHGHTVTISTSRVASESRQHEDAERTRIVSAVKKAGRSALSRPRQGEAGDHRKVSTGRTFSLFVRIAVHPWSSPSPPPLLLKAKCSNRPGEPPPYTLAGLRGFSTSPSGASRHLPMNGEEQVLYFPTRRIVQKSEDRPGWIRYAYGSVK